MIRGGFKTAFMKIVNKPLKHTANISSARGSAGKEFWKLVLSAIVLLMVLYFTIGVGVDSIVSRISFETEAKIFKHYQLPVVDAEEGSHQKDLEKIRAILSRLQTQQMVPPLAYKIVIVEDKSPNAFAFPGGTIGVTSGLMDALRRRS